MESSTSDHSEIVFFDTETTIPYRKGQSYHLLEFGAILVCRWRLLELDNYSTLIKPSDISAVTADSVKCNGITREAVSIAPSFSEIADKIYEILHGRIWAGHNIVRFDCVRIREAFAAIGRPAPEPKGLIDTLTLLTQRFGRRAGDMKMASIATYFGLGQQSHRSLDDVRMNLEVVKYCSTVLFLESCLPNILTPDSWVSPNTTSKSQNNQSAFRGERVLNTPISAPMFEDNHTIAPLNIMTEAEVHHPVSLNTAKPNPFDMSPLIDQIEEEPTKPDARMEEISLQNSPDIPANPVANEGSSSNGGFVDPNEVSVPSLTASLLPSFWGQTIQLLHKDVLLQLHCAKLRLRFGVSKKFVDSAGRPRLSIVMDSPSSLCRVLDVCDHLAQKLSTDSGSSSTWRPVVTRKNDFFNSSTIRLNLPTVSNGSTGSNSVYSTEIYQKDGSGSSQKLVFNRFDATQLDSLFVPGALVDTFFSLNVYDFQQFAGIRLVAKKLVINS
ncbi:hypothetical protein ACHQM5_008959 [Ranunculus cassubicifolius]